jgi:glyoxylate/hydroxypyruvate reductase
VSLLIAVTWEPQPWVERFKLHLPGRDIFVLGEDFDRRAIRYVATWGPKPGSISGLPVLEAIFSLGAGVDHLMNYPDLPDVPIVRVSQDDLTNRMSEYVVMHCLMHLRDQRHYDEEQRPVRARRRTSKALRYSPAQMNWMLFSRARTFWSACCR